MVTQSPIVDFLQQNGLVPESVRPDTQGNIRIPCFDQCQDEGKHKPHLSVNSITGSFQCFRCGYAGRWDKLRRRFEPPTPEEYAMAQAQNYFSSNLSEVLPSLQARGFHEDFLWKVGIGYAKPGYRQKLEQGNVSLETLIKLGLIAEIINEDKTVHHIETLADRITIPFYRSDGELYTFKARARMEDENNGRKYVTLGGTQWSGPYNERALTRQDGEVIACEGEFDALILMQYGLNAVGLPGASSFKAEWFKDVSVTFIFDNDVAGHKGLEKALQSISECKAFFLPEGTDTNSFIVERGFEAFVKMLSTASPYADGKKEESDHLGHRLAAYDDWAHSNHVMLGAETGFSSLSKSIDGWQDGLIIIPGGSNIGKSTLMIQCADQAVECNEDVIACILSIDDSERTTFTKLLAYKANITYAQASKPRTELASNDLMKNFPDKLKRRKDALARLSELSNRLIIRDVRFGRSLKQFERWVKKLRRTNPDKRLLFFVDSFDKMLLSDTNLQNTDTKGSLIQEVKRITTEQRITVITSAELRKIGAKRPELSDIKDTTQIEYECDAAISIYQALHHDPQTPIHFEDETGKRQPILEMYVLKNKMSGFKGGPLLFYFDAGKSRLEQVPKEKRDYYLRLIREDKDKNKKQGGR